MGAFAIKQVIKITAILLLTVLTACLVPIQVFADSLPEYISEVKVFYDNASAAQEEGYTVLSDDKGKPVDLNQGAGGGLGSKGDRAVFLGYKTTKNADDAITDLALMNMKGGYSVAEYDALMETQLKSQIIPFVERFRTVIDEYRQNYNGSGDNKQRADYIHGMLNKLTDDDCGGRGLGDLLLNKTKYEMGDDAYNALSDSEKENHADILTIIAQANGQATLLMESLLTRAADTSDDTWIDRLVSMTYDDMVDETGLAPTDAQRELSRIYNDDANVILDMWSDLKADLEKYDEARAFVDSYDEKTVKDACDGIEALGRDTEPEKNEKAADELLKAQEEEIKYLEYAEIVGLYEYLEETEYNGSTLLDFFSADSEEIEDDINILYPIVASLSPGQRAGLEFVSLKELIAIAATDAENYSEADIDSIEATSVYEGVDRTIYEKGGVALTSDALRTDAMNKANEEKSKMFGSLSIAFMALTGVAAVGFIASTVVFAAAKIYLAKEGFASLRIVSETRTFLPRYLSGTYKVSRISGKMMAGFSVAMVVIAGITTYLAWRDMQAYYKVDFTPIPHYMVDEKDIIGYNKKGEKIVLKNQSAYYKAAESNAKAGDFKFSEIGNLADMNGCVGKQWMALYVNKNELMNPILASSLKAVVGSSEIPSGYTKGIHMFGSDAAFNLNSNLYDWNNSAKSVFVYFKTDDGAAAAAGSNFSGGALALTGGAGLAAGAVAVALGITAARRKKEKTAA